MNNEVGQPVAPISKGDCTSALVFGALWLWIVFILIQRLAMEIFLSILTPDEAGAKLVYLPVIESIAILLPALPLAFLWKNPIYRAAFRTWAWAAVFILIQLPMHFTRITGLQAQAAWSLVGSIVFSSLLLILMRWVKLTRIGFQLPRTDYRIFIVFMIAGFIALPWFAWGALGSFTDTLLQLTSGLAFGAAAAILIESRFLINTEGGSPKPRTTSGWNGLVIATTLAILASGLGFNFGVIQSFLILVLIPLGWIWSYLRRLNQTGSEGKLILADLSFPILLIGLAVAFPLMLVDPNELALIISLARGEIIQWASQAASVSFVFGLLWIGFLYFYVRHKRRSYSSGVIPEDSPARAPKAWLLGAVLVWISGFVIYFAIGQPGFFGDRIFVILDNKVDLKTASTINDYAQRRQFVYQSLITQAETSQAALRNSLDRWHIDYQPFYLVNGIEVTNNPLLWLWLRNQPGITEITDSPHMRPLPEPLSISTGTAQQPTTPDWNLTQIGADRVWKDLGVTGQGIIVGQSDSGVQWDHPELRDSYRGKDGQNDYNWLDPWNDSPMPVDQNGHGTHTLGTVLGNQTGVAPDATWIACANLDRNLGNPALYLDCMQFMLAPYPHGGNAFVDGRPDLGAMVLNNSWGCPKMEGCQPDTLTQAVQALRQAGIFTIAGAGNDGPACSSLTDPLAIYEQVLSVGAIDRSGQLASFSSRGPVSVDGSQRIKPDLVAPGVDILSSFPGYTYAIESGTSMSGPHVAGVVALMWSANPALIGNIDRTEQILTESAQKYRGTLPDCEEVNNLPSTATGYGIVDAYAAVKQALGNP